MRIPGNADQSARTGATYLVAVYGIDFQASTNAAHQCIQVILLQHRVDPVAPGDTQ